MVFAAAGAITAPMWNASVIPKSTTLPNVAEVIFIFDFLLETKAHAAPVTVNVAVLGLGPPYSIGCLNCFSDVQLCDDTETIEFLICLAY